VAVIVPVKSFSTAKSRLDGAMTRAERADLARAMAAGVIAAARPLTVWVVCDHPEVAAWAAGHGAGVVRQTRPGLDQAVLEATRVCAQAGHRRVIVAHGDLPRARELAWVGSEPGVTIVPDRRGDGTNVVSVPADTDFRFAYGPGSAARHRAEAERLGLPVRVVADDDLGWDVDVPEDLAVFEQRRAG
jgi:2-phospho-L-lactate guanylyltransferase